MQLKLENMNAALCISYSTKAVAHHPQRAAQQTPSHHHPPLPANPSLHQLHPLPPVTADHVIL
jgi:hypothetical protein